jgi:hypothetical protein
MLDARELGNVTLDATVRISEQDIAASDVTLRAGLRGKY